MRIFNKRARYEYGFSGDKLEAGISLLGSEARAIREGHADLTQSVARVLEGEVWLINANISVDHPPKGYNSTRSRKLLLNRSEIISLSTKIKQQRLTLVPVSIYNKPSLRPDGRKQRLVKVGLALGKPKRQFEKREALKKKDIQRELEQELRVKN